MPIYGAYEGDIVGLDHSIQSYSQHLTSLRAEKTVKVAIFPIKDF